jgi:hypothetical protein
VEPIGIVKHESDYIFKNEQYSSRLYEIVVERLTAAFPPASRILRPHLAAKGRVHVIIPSALLLLGNNINSGTAARYTDLWLDGILNRAWVYI